MAAQNDSFRERVHSASKGGKVWKPKENDCLIGVLKDVREVKTQRGQGKIIDILDDETGEVLSVWMCVVLEREFEEQGIQVGEHLGFHYLGNEKGYHDFVVMVDREVK